MTCQIKKAIIIGDGVRYCPFGLPVPSACSCVGKAIHRMAPLESVEKEDQHKIQKANRMVMVYHKENTPCVYADKILKEHNKVDCDYQDTGEGRSDPALRGSPLYPSLFSGVGLEGLYGFPLAYWSDNSAMRNMFYGLFSYLGSAENEIIKNSNNKLDILVDGILDKIKTTDISNKEELNKLEQCLAELRDKYDEMRKDPAMIQELANKYLSPHNIDF